MQTNSFPPFELQFKVRDYECDMEGIVNNAVYQNYLEHTRHEMLISRGTSFAQMVEQKIFPVIARVDIRYKQSLRSGDEFVVTCQTEKEGYKLMFYQKIYRLPDRKLCAEAVITGVVTKNGVMVKPTELEAFM
jgi:acyl-CoA thioester hydrolase